MNGNETLILRSRKYKWLFIFVVSIIIFFFSLYFLINLDDAYETSSLKGIVFFIGLFNSAFLIYSFVRLLPGSSYLRLDKKGLKWQSIFYGDHYSWQDVSNFYVNKFGFVLFDVSEQGRSKSKLENQLSYDLQKVRRVFGQQAALPESYGKTPQQLADLLNSWKQKYSS